LGYIRKAWLKSFTVFKKLWKSEDKPSYPLLKSKNTLISLIKNGGGKPALETKGLKELLLFFLMEPFGDLPIDQAGVAAGAVVDDQADLDFVLLGLVYDLGRVLDHLRIRLSLAMHVLHVPKFAWSSSKQTSGELND